MLATRLQYKQRGQAPRSLYKFCASEGSSTRVVLIDKSFARINGATENGVEQPLDALNFRMIGKVTKDGMLVDGNFILTWFDDYTMLYRGTEVFHLKCEREQRQIPRLGCTFVDYVERSGGRVSSSPSSE